jgi:hypothetical protein
VVDAVGMAVETEGEREGSMAMGMAGRIDVRMAGGTDVLMGQYGGRDRGRDDKRDDEWDGGLAQRWPGWMPRWMPGGTVY